MVNLPHFNIMVRLERTLDYGVVGLQCPSVHVYSYMRDFVVPWKPL